MGDLILEQPVSQKRDIDHDTQNDSACCAASSPSACNSDEPGCCVAPTQRVTPAESFSSSVPYALGRLSQETTHPLPMYSNELGRLPVHDHFDAPAQVAVLDVTDNFEWYPPHFATTPGSEHSAPRWSPTNVVSNSGLTGVGDGTSFYTMDQLFFEQMTAKFPDPFAKNFTEPEIYGDQPPYQHSGSNARSFFDPDGSTGPQSQGIFECVNTFLVFSILIFVRLDKHKCVGWFSAPRPPLRTYNRVSGTMFCTGLAITCTSVVFSMLQSCCISCSYSCLSSFFCVEES
jgi:hypothetical protein